MANLNSKVLVLFKATQLIFQFRGRSIISRSSLLDGDCNTRIRTRLARSSELAVQAS